ncbi:hypothetical protein MCOR25_003737 [Pyricularia grisea]|uniref:Uncharacterized protein n=1 Tax=Pyricularia grisea TaxID=148305 RepID=A0A6P8B9E0_PYRGI|nr:uncharacterized protein PgNI_04974 [Pyricularia grisea]KAI6372416.1 hypothetical protein MCOR25_003737 [Pyricularia grisea]TLD12444.1 hypothetical protein PgNI_04974 [Pyricularia grisea]
MVVQVSCPANAETHSHTPPSEQPQIPTRPKVHSMRYHSSNVYVGTTTMPSAFSVRPASGTSNPDDTSDYIVELFYHRNRACSLYRTEDDFRALVSGIMSSNVVPNMPSLTSPPRVQDLEAALALAIRADRTGCAVEYFLRRRMEDCGGS